MKNEINETIPDASVPTFYPINATRKCMVSVLTVHNPYNVKLLV